jgi:hypothetical protein
MRYLPENPMPHNEYVPWLVRNLSQNQRDALEILVFASKMPLEDVLLTSLKALDTREKAIEQGRTIDENLFVELPDKRYAPNVLCIVSMYVNMPMQLQAHKESLYRVGLELSKEVRKEFDKYK